MNGAIITRFRSSDYEPLVNDNGVYEYSRNLFLEYGFNRAIDDTRPSLIYFVNTKDSKYVLRLTGIPSQRRDKVNTKIRYSIVIEASDYTDIAKLRKYVSFLLNYFSNNNQESEQIAYNSLVDVGIQFDRIVGEYNNNFSSIPFLDALDATLLGKEEVLHSKYENIINNSNFILYSPIVKTVHDIEEIISKKINNGFVLIGSSLNPLSFALKKKEKKIHLSQRSKLLFAGILLYFLGIISVILLIRLCPASWKKLALTSLNLESVYQETEQQSRTKQREHPTSHAILNETTSRQTDKPKEIPQPKADKPKEIPQPKADKPKENPQPKADKPKEIPQPKADKPKEIPQPKADKPKEIPQLKADKPKEIPQPKADKPKGQKQTPTNRER